MNLPRRQKQLYDLLLGRGDVLIMDLYHEMHSTRRPRNAEGMTAVLVSDHEDVAAQQRWLTPYIALLNERLVDHGLRVEPGALKNTYRLVASS